MRRRSFLKLLLSPLLAAVPAVMAVPKRSVVPDLLEPLDPPFVAPAFGMLAVETARGTINFPVMPMTEAQCVGIENTPSGCRVRIRCRGTNGFSHGIWREREYHIRQVVS